jgi:tRNA 2-thiouridine synthesizing protein D
LTNHNIESVACVSSALVRGILDTDESARHKMAGVSLLESTQISGLGQLVDASIQSERLVSFA